MDKNNIFLTENVNTFLTQLIETLLENEYFNYLENAEEYVEDLRKTIKNYLPLHQHRKSPLKLTKYGTFYIIVPKNKNTSWYIFFDKLGNLYRVNHITNNHSAEASLINSLKT